MPSILLRDPWSIELPGDWVKNHDTGWGNRLIALDFVLQIREALGSKHRIETLEKEFPETHYINLPYVSHNLETPNLFGGVVPHSYHIISNDIINNWKQTGKLDLDPSLNYTTHYSFDTILKYFHIYQPNFPANNYLKKIKLKNKALETSLNNYSKNIIGLHIRRGHGVFYSPLDWELIPDQVKNLYDPCFVCDESYRIVNDTRIFEIIDYFLKNTTNKIYISIDIDEKAISYYKKKFPNKILTCGDFIKSNQDIVNKSNILKPIGNLKSIGYNLIDFFILGRSKFILESKNSTWSKLAVFINDRPSSVLHNSIEDIIKDYNELSSK